MRVERAPELEPGGDLAGLVELADPAGYPVGEVLRVQTEVGQDLAAAAVRMPARLHPYLVHWRGHARVAEPLRHRATDSAGTDSVLHHDDEPVRGGQSDQLNRYRTHPAWVHHGDAVPVLAQPSAHLEAEVGE